MNIVVLLAGIADPKWPLPPVALDPAAMRKNSHLILSPFDEAALEIALQIRETLPGTSLTIGVTGGAESDALLRKAAAYRPNRAVRIETHALHPWDAREQAEHLSALLPELDEAADLLLVGREFGDYDAGSLPPGLAAALGWGFFGLTQYVRRDGDKLLLLREQASLEETHMLSAPLVASVTNDRRNRLRHPLMKNVMEAKRMNIDVLRPTAPQSQHLSLDDIVPAPPPLRAGTGRILSGALDAQIADLADFLAAWRTEL